MGAAVAGIPWSLGHVAGQFCLGMEKIKMRGPRNSMRHVDIARATHAANLTQAWRRTLQAAHVVLQYRHAQSQGHPQFVGQNPMHVASHAHVLGQQSHLFAQSSALLAGQQAGMSASFVGSAGSSVSPAGAIMSMCVCVCVCV